MLTKTENKVMRVIYSECKKKGALLITPTDLIKLTGNGGLTYTSLEKIMKDLYMDGYFDLVYSDRKGETVYCVTLTEKGKGYLRKITVMKRNLLFRLGLSAVLALFSFLIGILLKAIF